MKLVEEQIILVTGATDGLGKGVAFDLAKRGATVLVHGRDTGRIERTLDAILKSTGNPRCRGYRADFTSLAEVRELAAHVLEREKRLDVLVNNAGIGTEVPGGGARDVSRDGHEVRFAVNYLAPYLLTRLLLPLIKSSAPARVVNVSSLGQQAIDFDDVMLERKYSGVRAYCQSSSRQILSTIDEAAELEGSGVTVNALHPATYMPTKIVPHPMSTLEAGVDATVRLIVDPALDAVSGKFWNGQSECEAAPQAYDEQARKKLRALSDRLNGLA